LSLFLTNKELDFFNSINEELINEVIGQTIILYKVDPSFTKSDIYGESDSKVFGPGYEFNALINFLEPIITTTHTGGVNQIRKIEVFIQRKSLSDIEIIIEEGDYLLWDNQYFEITKCTEPKIIEGLPIYKHNIRLEAISVYINVRERKQ